MQWGIATAPNGNDLINLNIPFETMNYQTIVSDSGGGVHVISSVPVSVTQFRAYGKPNGRWLPQIRCGCPHFLRKWEHSRSS